MENCKVSSLSAKDRRADTGRREQSTDVRTSEVKTVSQLFEGVSFLTEREQEGGQQPWKPEPAGCKPTMAFETYEEELSQQHWGLVKSKSKLSSNEDLVELPATVGGGRDVTGGSEGWQHWGPSEPPALGALAAGPADCSCRFAPSPCPAGALADHGQHRVVPSLVVNLGPTRQVKISPIKQEDMTDQPSRKRRLSLCVGCGAQIHDQYILRVAPDLEWHAACLKCAECHQFLDETCTCFVRDGKTYCKRDYVRLFGTKCDKCGQSFSKNDFVMRAKSKIYHIECFRCTACERQLIPGDEFALRDDGLFCKEDHEVLDKPCTGESNNNSTNVINNNSSSSIHNEGSNSDSSESGSNKGKDARSGSSTKISSEGKPTRVRTVLNEKQLHTLRTCYNANPRPDALMKEQLVEMTSLSPRVIRVWFQNKRCKDKKRAILLKQQMQQEKDGRKLGYGTMQGIPMVASSPVRHESPLGMNPIEVHSYQPPWKALSDFALHTDLDRLDPSAPPFQHLVNQMHGYDMHGPPPHPDIGPPPPEVGHPDSTDSYVTYLESDDSLHHDTSSP